jgi:predicted metal-binding membrane protein
MLAQRLQALGLGPLGLLLWGVSLGAMAMIMGQGGSHVSLPVICRVAASPAIEEAANALDFTVHTVSLPAVLTGAVLMVAAMMTPALAGPLLHLWYRSLSRHRWRAIALFVTGYLAIWTMAFALLIATSIVLLSLAPSTLAVGLVVGLVGLAWHFSAARSVCLARCHSRPRLSIFGMAAVADPLLYGFTHGTWCVTTCWAVMLLPLCLSEAHMPIMAAGAMLVASERLGQRR